MSARFLKNGVKAMLKNVQLIGPMTFSFMMIYMTGCAQQPEYATDKPFILVTNYSAGPDDYRNMYHVNIAIDQNGRLQLYADEDEELKIDDDAPVFETQLDEEQIDALQKVIEEQQFWELPEDVSTPSEDGGFSYITVNRADESKKVGGLNVDDEQFMEIRQQVFDLVDPGDYNEWTVDIEEFIWEKNSLRFNEKTDFVTDEPFFILTMEQLTDEEYPSVYEHVISIDIGGNLTQAARGESDLEIGADAPVLTVTLADQEIEELKQLIHDHFWKLNESIAHADGKRYVQSITVQLAEEAKTVSGLDPIHERFVTIRDGIIQLIDDADYEQWTNDINTYLREKKGAD